MDDRKDPLENIFRKNPAVLGTSDCEVDVNNCYEWPELKRLNGRSAHVVYPNR
jgi:hypothetical protein